MRESDAKFGYEIKRVHDPKNGDHFITEGLTGDFYFMTPYKKTPN